MTSQLVVTSSVCSWSL